MDITVRHYIPPPERRTGGLDTALVGLNAHLRASGIDSELVSTAALFGSGAWGVPVIAHFHGLWEPGHWLLVRRMKRSGAKVVVSPHGMLEPWAFRHRGWKKRPVFRLIEEPRLRSADAVMATSQLEADNLRRLTGGLSLRILPLGLDAPADSASVEFRVEARDALGLAPSGRMALFLSRIHPKKGLDMLLRAWRDLAGKVTARQAVLCIVGPGDDGYADECQALADDCRARGAEVRWIGPVWGEDRWRFFAAADLFCLPSFSENFGFVVPEAWMCGTEVLTTNQTPWAEQAGMEGLTVAAPEPDEIRNTLDNWLGRSVFALQQRTALARWARGRFSWPQVIPNYIEFYASLIAQSESTT